MTSCAKKYNQITYLQNLLFCNILFLFVRNVCKFVVNTCGYSDTRLPLFLHDFKTKSQTFLSNRISSISKWHFEREAIFSDESDGKVIRKFCDGFVIKNFLIASVKRTVLVLQPGSNSVPNLRGILNRFAKVFNLPINDCDVPLPAVKFFNVNVRFPGTVDRSRYFDLSW